MDATVDRSQRSGFLVVRIALGVLLLATAGLKFVDPSPDALSGLELLSSPRWRMAAIEVEAFLGLWLLAGAFPRLLWSMALLCFALLAGVSLYLGIEGQSSCGCFGAKLPVSPWYAMGLDMTSVASLLWWRPRPRQQTEVSYSVALRRTLAVVAGAGAILVVGFGGLTWMYGSLSGVLVHLRDESMIVHPSVPDAGDGGRVTDDVDVLPRPLDLGERRLGTTAEGRFWIRARSGGPIQAVEFATTDRLLTRIVARRSGESWRVDFEQLVETPGHGEYTGVMRVKLQAKGWKEVNYHLKWYGKVAD